MTPAEGRDDRRTDATGGSRTPTEGQTQIPTTSPGETLQRTIEWFQDQGAIASLGIACFGPVDLDTASLRKVIDLNYLGTVLPIKALLPLMLKNGHGNILNISSMAATRPMTRVMGYASAKAAIDNLTKWLSVELAHKHGPNFRVNAIAPGFFLTEQNRTLLTEADGSLTQRGNQIITHTPMNRFGKPEDLLGALQWLCSDASAFVTGTIVAVDGGFSAYSGV